MIDWISIEQSFWCAWGCRRRCLKNLSVRLQCQMDGRAGDAMRLAPSTTSSTSRTTSITSSFYTSFTSFFLFLSTIFLIIAIAEAGTHLDEPWFRWRDGNVNFYFKVLVNIFEPAQRNILWIQISNMFERLKRSLPTIAGHDKRWQSGYAEHDENDRTTNLSEVQGATWPTGW